MDKRQKWYPPLHTSAMSGAGQARRHRCRLRQCRWRQRRGNIRSKLEVDRGIGGLALLPEPRDGVVEEPHQDDGQGRPVPHQLREHRGGLDHVGDGPREKAQELLQLVDLFLYQLVAAALLEPLLRLARREALGGRRERCLDGVETRLLQVVCASRLSIGCEFLVCFVHAVSSVIPLDTRDTAGFALIGVATISGPGCCWLESTRSRSGGVRSPVR
jgi:hypothetical protein